MEAQAYQTLLEYSGATEKTVRALTGGMRLSNVLGALRRLAKLTSYKFHSEEEMDDLFNQINAIAEFRDRLVHRVPTITEQRISSNNLATYKLLEDLEEITFTLRDIRSASSDLEFACVRLQWLLEQDSPWHKTRSGQRYRRMLFQPWLYKPLRPHTPLKHARKRTQ